MSTALLALGLLIGLGIIVFLTALGLGGLGLILSWVLPLTPFQATVVHLVLFSLATAFIGLTLLFERLKDTLWGTAEDEEALEGEVDYRLHNGTSSTPQRPLPPRREPVKIGRNDPCPCGSGKKYKSCCLLKR